MAGRSPGPFLGFGQQVVVDLAGAEQYPARARGPPLEGGVVYHRPEPAAGEILQRRDGLGITQQALGRQDDERPLSLDLGLAAQQVEVLRRSGTVGDPDVAFRGQLEKPLEPGARVLRTLPFVPVRQQQHQPGGEAPLGETARDELVDDDLGAIDEVAELGLPEDQGPGRGGAVAVLETEGGQFGQGAVVEFERRHGTGKPAHRSQGGAGVHVMQDQVTMTERAALGVLAGEPDRVALGQE